MLNWKHILKNLQPTVFQKAERRNHWQIFHWALRLLANPVVCAPKYMYTIFWI